MCICVSVSVCVCVFVCNTTNLQKNYMLKCPFLWLETGSFTETGKRLIIIVYECLRGPSMVLLFSPVNSRWSECVAAAKKFGKKRTRAFEDDVFIENTRLVGGSKTQDLVLSMSRGPPGQWFPETEYWASAIFVGTSGIPPKIIYRSVKSYKFHFFALSWNPCWCSGL